MGDDSHRRADGESNLVHVPSPRLEVPLVCFLISTVEAHNRRYATLYSVLCSGATYCVCTFGSPSRGRRFGGSARRMSAGAFSGWFRGWGRRFSGRFWGWSSRFRVSVPWIALD